MRESKGIQYSTLTGASLSLQVLYILCSLTSLPAISISKEGEGREQETSRSGSEERGGRRRSEAWVEGGRREGEAEKMRGRVKGSIPPYHLRRLRRRLTCLDLNGEREVHGKRCLFISPENTSVIHPSIYFLSPPSLLPSLSHLSLLYLFRIQQRQLADILPATLH